jgi:hypothetical protein
MDWLEEELKRALARQEPAPGFAQRVRRRIAGGIPARRWLALAASVVVVAGGGLGYRWHEGVQAKKQVMVAVRLTAGKLNRVQSHIREVGQ